MLVSASVVVLKSGLGNGSSWMFATLPSRSTAIGSNDEYNLVEIWHKQVRVDTNDHEQGRDMVELWAYMCQSHD